MHIRPGLCGLRLRQEVWLPWRERDHDLDRFPLPNSGEFQAKKKGLQASSNLWCEEENPLRRPGVASFVHSNVACHLDHVALRTKPPIVWIDFLRNIHKMMVRAELQCSHLRNAHYFVAGLNLLSYQWFGWRHENDFALKHGKNCECCPYHSMTGH